MRCSQKSDQRKGKPSLVKTKRHRERAKEQEEIIMNQTDTIKQQINLADYVRSCGIKLTKHGKSDLKGLCPFHSDTNPSMIITPLKGLFNCPVCNTGGSVIDFASTYHNTNLKITIKELSKLLSSQPEKSATKNKKTISGNPCSSVDKLSPERSNELLERVISFYEKTFAGDTITDEKGSPTSEGKYYLELRGITDAGLFSKHRIGYADGSLLNALPKDGKILEELETLGVLVKLPKGGYIERFRYCVVFPVLDVEGNITTLYARSCETGTNRNHLYLPNRPTGLFNVGIIKTYPEIVLVESCIDALSLEMAGVNNVVSIQSTNGLNDKEIALLAGCEACPSSGVVSKVTLLLDGDNPGIDATIRLVDTLSEHFKVATIALPLGDDPNSYLQRLGSEKLLSLLAATPAEFASNNNISKTKSITETKNVNHTKDGFTLKMGLRYYEIIGLEKKPRNLKATIRVEKAGKLHVDTIDFYSSRQRRQLSQDICNAFEELPDTINADISKLMTLCEATASKKEKNAGSENSSGGVDERPTITPIEEKEAEAFGKKKDLIEQILKDYEKCGLIGEESNKLLCYLAMTSRKMQTPLSVLVLSSSGAGKTALQDAALEFCPPEELLKLTSLSGKALFYMEQTSLKHKVLAIEEGAGAEDATYAIRNLISSNGLTSEVAMRDPQTGKLTTMSNKVEGPVSVFCTTTNPEVDPETKSRFLVTGIDESREQTRRILAFQKQRHSLNGLQVNLEKENTLRVHRNFQRLLKPLAIVNPHIDQLSYSDDRLQGRRAQPQYLNIINTVAFLRQMQKEVKVCKHTTTSSYAKATADKKKNKNSASSAPLRDNLSYIEVDETDIEIGNKLAVEILGKTLDELSIPARDLLELIDKMLSARLAEIVKKEGKENGTFKRDLTFTRRELREFSGWTNTRLHNHIKELVCMEYIVMESGRINSIQTYKMLFNGKTDETFRQEK